MQNGMPGKEEVWSFQVRSELEGCADVTCCLSPIYLRSASRVGSHVNGWISEPPQYLFPLCLPPGRQTVPPLRPSFRRQTNGMRDVNREF